MVEVELFEHYRIEDVNRIYSVLKEHGHILSLKGCADIWELYSDDQFAGWKFLPEKDDDLWDIVKTRILKYPLDAETFLKMKYPGGGIHRFSKFGYDEVIEIMNEFVNQVNNE